MTGQSTTQPLRPLTLPRPSPTPLGRPKTWTQNQAIASVTVPAADWNILPPTYAANWRVARRYHLQRYNEGIERHAHGCRVWHNQDTGYQL